MIIRLGQRNLKTKFGTFLEVLYYDGQKESVALVMGNVENGEQVLCRVHSACLAGHVFNSIECDCREQLELAQFLIAEHQQGLIIWLDQEGKNNGHLAILMSASLKAAGLSQSEAYVRLGYPADARNYQNVAEILADLKVKSINLLTNSPNKLEPLTNVGVQIASTKSLHLDTQQDAELIKTFQTKLVQCYK